jgi:Spy/CpxP family protein refolding chaperone
MRIRSAVAIAAVVTLVIGAVALASPQDAKGPGPMGHPEMLGPGMGGPGMHGGFGMIGLPLHRLDLTQEQQDKVHAILDEEQLGLKALRTQLRDGETAFRAAHPITEFDENAIREHVAAQARIQADLEVALAKVRSKVVALLTAEQLKTAQEIQAKMQERMSHAEFRHQRPDAPATQ